MMKSIGNFLSKSIMESHPNKNWSDFINAVIPEDCNKGQDFFNNLYLEHFAF